MSDGCDDQLESNDANPNAFDDDTQMSDALCRLKTSKMITEQCFQSGLELVEAVSKYQGLSVHLSRFIMELEQSQKSLNQNPESGGSSWQTLLLLSKAKVFTVVSGETFNAYKCIKSKLKSKVDMVQNPQNCDVIVLVCPITSRAGSNVEAALKKIPESGRMKPVILVLLHHTRRVDYSAFDSDWSVEHSTVASHVDMLFHESQKGLLTCQKNEQAIHNLLELCMSYPK